MVKINPTTTYSALETAQHGPKGLDGILKFGQEIDAGGLMLSNFLTEDGNGGFVDPDVLLEKFGEAGLKLAAFSAHCPFWVHGTAWTGSPTIKPFIPAELHNESPEKIEAWAEDYILRFLDTVAGTGIKTIGMFWGVYFGWELAGGYPWGFWSGPGYDLLEAGKERFVKKTAKIRAHANSLGLKNCHEIHPMTAARCARDMLLLREITGGDDSVVVLADPSHCWEGESFRTRFTMPGIAEHVWMIHAKDHKVLDGHSVLCMQPDFKHRPMRFCKLGTGDLDLKDFVDMAHEIGYVDRYCEIHDTDQAPVPAEAESAHEDLDETAAEGVQFLNTEVCTKRALVSFEEGMGDEKD